MVDLSIYNITNENWDPAEEGIFKNIKEAHRARKNEKNIRKAVKTDHASEWQAEKSERKKNADAFTAASKKIANEYLGGASNNSMWDAAPLYQYVAEPFVIDNTDGNRYRWKARFKFITEFDVSIGDYRKLIDAFKKVYKQCPLVTNINVSPIKRTSSTDEDKAGIKYTEVAVTATFTASDKWKKFISENYNLS